MQVHFLSKRMVYLALVLLRYLSLSKVDALMVLLSKLVYGDLAKYGIARPKEGPFFMKIKYGKYPAIDVGTCSKIKSGEIQVNKSPSPLPYIIFVPTSRQHNYNDAISLYTRTYQG